MSTKRKTPLATVGGMSPRKADLVDMAEIAERLRVPLNTVKVWRRRQVLPLADYVFSGTPVWHWSKIKRWHETRGHRGITGSELGELLTAKAVGELLGISRQRVSQLLTSDPSFPAPALVKPQGRAWRREDIEAWARAREASA